MTAAEVVDLIVGYGKAGGAPVATNTTVTARAPGRLRLRGRHDQGRGKPAAVVLASGLQPGHGPGGRRGRPAPGSPRCRSWTTAGPRTFPTAASWWSARRPVALQIADELHRSGRPGDTWPCGEHVRLPRDLPIPKDILWWMDAAGCTREGYREVLDIVRARNLPSMQLVGTPQRTTMDAQRPVRYGHQPHRGRLGAIRDGVALFSGSLPQTFAPWRPQARPGRLLNLIDEWADVIVCDRPEQAPPRATRVPDAAAAGAGCSGPVGSRPSSGRPVTAGPTGHGSASRLPGPQGSVRTTVAVITDVPAST